MPPIAGGDLIIYKGEKELSVVSVPSLNLLAERYRDSVTGNDESFEDADGNCFDIEVTSSNVGVDWKVTVTTEDEELENQIHVEYRPNEF